ncbi:MAG TPA: pyridoxamine 5'-phosphate oxidase family protein [Oscillatoriaceae cyanobacterium]
MEILSLEELQKRVQSFKTAHLITVARDGFVHTRPMMNQPPIRDADLWFVTALDTEKVAEINAHPQVGVLFCRDSDGETISLNGRARFVTDPKVIAGRWREDWKAWFPRGPEAQRLAIIEIDLHEAGIWEPTTGQFTVIFERGARTVGELNRG